MTSIVEHHTHYREIDGYDSSIFMTMSEHKLIDHRELFPDVTPQELKVISDAAHQRGHRLQKKYLSGVTIEGMRIEACLSHNPSTDHNTVWNRMTYRRRLS